VLVAAVAADVSECAVKEVEVNAALPSDLTTRKSKDKQVDKGYCRQRVLCRSPYAIDLPSA
jgi:hypothetical protein